MPYVFDTSAFIIIGHYYPDQFPTFWKRFSTAVDSGEIVSVREALNELSTKASRPWLADWVKLNSGIFQVPTAEETAFVGEIFRIPQSPKKRRNRTQRAFRMCVSTLASPA
jgi:hypothetical protein